MEAVVMTRRRTAPRRGEAGFSMIEMLMAAFVLSVGILGLTMLQAMSIRVASGGHNLGMAVQLAERVMDQVEMEGRLTYLNANNTNLAPPSTLSGLSYITQEAVTQYYSIDPATGDPALLASATGAMFTLRMTQTVTNGTALSDVQVQVQYADSVNAVTNTPIQRTVTLNRRILHG
jgi:prepilin-type N-terminal cleavage/methylation domain-containing protein